jgi:hypothetical protein
MSAARGPISREDYAAMTGRPDLHGHYMGAYSTAWAQKHPDQDNPNWADADDASRGSGFVARRQANHGAGGRFDVDDSDRCTDCGHPRGCDCPHDCTYPGEHIAAVPGTPGGSCPSCGSGNTTQYANGQDCHDCGTSFGSGRHASCGSGPLHYVANGYPMGDARPKETLPTGETVGDGDSDYWEGGQSDTDSMHERGEHKTGSARCSGCGRRSNEGACQGCGQPASQCTCTPKGRKKSQPIRKRADFMSKPHQSTDDFTPVPNSPSTSPQPWSQNADPQSQDYQAGFSEGQQDARGGQRPTFMDNSDRVSGYVKGYAEGYSQAQPPDLADSGGHPGAAPRQNPDVPHSMGGDSGQARNSQEALQAAQRAQAVMRRAAQYSPDSQKKTGIRVSAGFVSMAAGSHPDFRKAYAFASKWKPGSALVRTGSVHFEAGLYAGMSDRPAAVQQAWIMAHRKMAAQRGDSRLSDRMARHAAFTITLIASGYRVRRNGVYAWMPQRRTAGTTTDLITDGPGTSPDPMGSTPLNGPGTPPSMGGGGDPARSGGPSPYQGAEPKGGGPVVQDDVMGPSQEPPNPVGPLAQGFSGPGPGYGNQDQVPRGTTDLAPSAPDTAVQSGYSNPDAYQGAPQGGEKVAAFRRIVQGNLQIMRAGTR